MANCDEKESATMNVEPCRQAYYRNLKSAPLVLKEKLKTLTNGGVRPE